MTVHSVVPLTSTGNYLQRCGSEQGGNLLLRLPGYQGVSSRSESETGVDFSLQWLLSNDIFVQIECTLGFRVQIPPPVLPAEQQRFVLPFKLPR